MARILVGVTGGIAAYKACTLMRLLVRAGHDVYPARDRGRRAVRAAETFFALARKSPSDDPYPHLERADLLVVAPLTANTLARLAHGLADDLLTEAALAHAGPVLVAPAMNVRMWEHPATQANVAIAARARRRDRRAGRGRARRGRGRSGEDGRSRRRSRPGSRSSSARLRWSRPRCTAAASSSRQAARGSRSTACASSETARRGEWASRSRRRRAARGADVTLLAANLAVSAAAGRHSGRDADRRRSRARGAGSRGCGRDRDGRRGRRLPAADARSPRSARRTTRPGRWSSSRRPTSSRRSVRGTAPARCSSASPPTVAAAGSSGRGRSGGRRTPTSSCSTTSSRDGHRLRRARERGDVLSENGRAPRRRRPRRGRSPRRSWTRWSGYSRT